MKDPAFARIARRLAPLYVAAFFHAFVLWYTIEKLFMHTIGFDDAGIGLMVAAYSAVMLLCETPSGILADRWSRKGTLMIASIFLAIASLVCGISDGPLLYVIGSLVWAIFFSLYSGTYDSIIYDTVKEESGSGELYEKFFGRFRIIDSIGLVSSALIGGLLASWLGLHAVYFLTIPLAIGSLVALWLFEEPKLHKAGQHENVVAHVRETFRLVLGQPAILSLVALIIMIILTLVMVYEFNQLWLIAFATPPAWFGVGVSAVMAAGGVAGYFVGKVKHRRKAAKVWLHSVLLLSGLALTCVPYVALASIALFLFAASGVSLNILAMRDLHDALPSRVRAGAASSLSTMARILVIPVSLIFGAISTAANIFAAAWVLVVLALCVLVLELRRLKVA